MYLSIIAIADETAEKLPFGFGINSEGEYGYIKVGADTVTPFRSQADVDRAYTEGYNKARSEIVNGAVVITRTFRKAWGGQTEKPATNIGSYTVTKPGNIAITVTAENYHGDATGGAYCTLNGASWGGGSVKAGDVVVAWSYYRGPKTTSSMTYNVTLSILQLG